MEKEKKYGEQWMVETTFSSIMRMFGEYISATKFQIGKRDDNEEIVIQTICLEELYKMNEYSLRKTSYATEQIDITYCCSVSALLHDCSIRHLLRF